MVRASLPVDSVRKSINTATPSEWDATTKQSEQKIYDEVQRPSHYNFGSIECIAAIEESMSREAFKGYLKGNALKYIWRMDYKKNALTDVEKALFYLTRLRDVLLKDGK